MYCTQCGARIPDISKFCNKCGARVMAPTNTPAHNKTAGATTAAPQAEPVGSIGMEPAPIRGDDEGLRTALQSWENGQVMTVPFGSYQQGARGESAPIWWYVLDRRGDEVLLLSRDVLDTRSFHSGDDALWEDSDLRQWLNGEFLTQAFSAEEQQRIQSTWLRNADVLMHWVRKAADTRDKVFVLSRQEAQRYFMHGEMIQTEARGTAPDNQGVYYRTGDIRTAAGVTDYAAAHGTGVYSGHAWWWLRSCGDRGRVMAVMPDAAIAVSGLPPATTGGGVRPALWLRVEV